MSTRNKPTPDVLISPLADDDRRFVLDSWSRSYRDSPSCCTMPTSAFGPWHRRRMLAILDRATVLVARDREHGAYILGYGVFERIDRAFIGHWLYTRQDHRRSGLARLLLASGLAVLGNGATELVASSRTYVGSKAEELGFRHTKLTDLAPYALVDKERAR